MVLPDKGGTMNTHKLIPILLALPLAVTSLACPTRVGPPEDGAGGSPSGGHGGASATDAGTGGTTGVAGAGGTIVVTGAGGTGVAGAGGTAGATGTGGTVGAAGASGMAGATGASGPAPTCSPDCSSSTQTCVGTSCLFNDGQSCSVASQCASNACTPFYVDVDGDHYGYGQAVSFCGTSPPNGYAAQGGDCCDDASDLSIARLIHPNAEFQATSAGGVCGITWDYDCNGGTEVQTYQYVTSCGPPPTCTPILATTTDAMCGGTESFSTGCAYDTDQSSQTFGQCEPTASVTKPIECR